MAMTYSEVQGMRKQALFPRKMMDAIDRILHFDIARPFKKYSPGVFKRYAGINAARAARLQTLENTNKGKLLAGLKGAKKTIAGLQTQLDETANSASKWRNRALVGGGLAITGTAAGYGMGKLNGGPQTQAAELPSYDEWRKQQGNA